MSDQLWARGSTLTLHLWKQSPSQEGWISQCGGSFTFKQPAEDRSGGILPHCARCERKIAPKPKRAPPDYEADLYQQIIDAGLPLPQRNAKWAFLAGMEYDFYWPLPDKHQALAVEVNGKIWHKGGHSSGYGLLRDYRKLLLSAQNGVTLIFVPPEWIKDGTALAAIRALLALD